MMTPPQRRFLLQLLILTSSYSRALDYYSYYDALKLEDVDIAETIKVASFCSCATICRARTDCTAASFVSGAYQSSDKECHISTKSHILKRHLKPTSGTDSVSLIIGYQILFSERASKLADAKAKCKAMEMRLVSLSDEATFDYVSKIIKRKHSNGDTNTYLVDLSKTKDKWVWGDGVVETADRGQGPWAADNPDSSTATEAVFTKDSNGRLDDVSPGNLHHFICSA